MYSNITKKIKIEFSDFLLRKYKISLKRHGNIMSVLQHNELVGQFFIIKTKNYIRLKGCEHEISPRLQEMLRFKLSTRNSIPVVLNENQCTQFNCFDKLIKQFESDWLIFNGIECTTQFPDDHTKTKTSYDTTHSKKSIKNKRVKHGRLSRSHSHDTSPSSSIPLDTMNINITVDPIKVEPIQFSNNPNQNITVEAKFPKDMKMILDILDDFQKKLSKVSLR